MITKITKAGRKSLTDDTQMSDEMRLMLEICSRLQCFTREEVFELCDECVDLYDGDIAAAIMGLKTGELVLEQDEEQT